MARVNLTLPDDLAQRVAIEIPNVCLSKLLQESLRQLLRCDHHIWRCEKCNQSVDQAEYVDRAVSRFYKEAMAGLTPLVDRLGTAEGAARILRRVGQTERVSAADEVPLPKPARASRHRVFDFPPTPKEPPCAATTSTIATAPTECA